MSSQFQPNDPANPYAAPTARIDDLDDRHVGELAPRGTRLGAAIIDMMTIMVPSFFALAMIGTLYARNQHAPVSFVIPVLVCVLLLAVLVANIVLVVRNQQSIGKRLCGIKVVRSDGRPCSALRVLLLRGLLTWVLSQIPLLGGIFGLVDPLLIFRDDRRCVHDLIADTTVVRV